MGAAVLWCGQGEMLARSSNERNKTLFASVCWGLLNCSQVPGSLAGHVLLARNEQHGSSSSSATPSSGWVLGWSDEASPLFTLLAAVGSLGLFSFLLLRPVDLQRGTPPSSDGKRPSIRSTIDLLCDRRMLLLAPLCE